MKSYNQWSRFLLGLFALALVSCTETEIDEEKPTITVNYAGGFHRLVKILVEVRAIQSKLRSPIT